MSNEKIVSYADHLRKEEERDRAFNKMMREWAEDCAAKRRGALAALVEKTPPLDIINIERWEEGTARMARRHGQMALRLAENWARLIQAELESGREFNRVVGLAFYEADVDGASSAERWAVIRLLSKSWAHGDRLKEWADAGGAWELRSRFDMPNYREWD